uniref:hypothetical protein n=1 Tax=Flavonifractor plautii TaxID=292800 RepID=UPI003D7DD354
MKLNKNICKHFFPGISVLNSLCNAGSFFLSWFSDEAKKVNDGILTKQGYHFTWQADCDLGAVRGAERSA